MSRIKLVMRKGVLADVEINGKRLPLVFEAHLNFEIRDKPILCVRRWKPDPETGRPYTIGGGYVADLEEYYPVDDLQIIGSLWTLR